MNVQIKSSNGITTMPMDTRLLADRKIFIEGEINQESACDFVKKVMLLTREDREKEMDVFINSPGGEINAGMLIYDVVQDSKTPIRMFCIGRAYSMAALLFASGNYGRYMLPHGELMLHEPLLGNRVEGNASSIQSVSEKLLDTKRKMNQILAKHTKMTEAEIEEATRSDHYYSAKESVEFGLADRIIRFDMIVGRE